MIFEDAGNPSVNAKITSGGKTGVLEAMGATFAASRNNDLMDSRDIALEAAYDRRNERISKATGVILPNPKRDTIFDAHKARREKFKNASSTPPSSFAENFKAQSDWYENKVNELRLSRPDVISDIPDMAAMDSEMKTFAHALERKVSDLQSRGSKMTAAAAFVGGVGAGLTDTVNIVTLPLGSGAKTIAGTALKTGAVNAAVETFSQPFVQANRSDLGLESGIGLAARNVGFAFVGGGLLGGAGKAAGHLPALRDQVELKLSPGRYAAREMRKIIDDVDADELNAILSRRDLVSRFDKNISNVDGIEGQYRHEVEQDIRDDMSSPVGDDPVAIAAHRERLGQALRGEPVTPHELPIKGHDIIPGPVTESATVVSQSLSPVRPDTFRVEVEQLDLFTDPHSAEVRTQTAALESNLFGEGVKLPKERAVPIGEVLNDAGVRQSHVMSGDDVDVMIKQDDTMIEHFKACANG